MTRPTRPDSGTAVMGQQLQRQPAGNYCGSILSTCSAASDVEDFLAAGKEHARERGDAWAADRARW